MGETKIMNETFSIQFSGASFDNHEIPASALAQSLLSLDCLAKRVAQDMYGKDAQTEVKVKAGFRKGSFIVDLIAVCQNNPEEALGIAAAAVTVAGGVVATIKGVIKLGKFAFGKKVEATTGKGTGATIQVTNNVGQVNEFNSLVVNIYNQDRTRSLISRLTQTLDQDGVDSIKIYTDDNDQTAEEIGKREREFFRYEDGIVLTDNESEVILEVVGPMVNGSKKGWRFSEGSDGIEFTASVEDDVFLGKVRDREIKFENGTAIRAILRTVQRKNIRTVTDRIVVEVKEVFPASDALF